MRMPRVLLAVLLGSTLVSSCGHGGKGSVLLSTATPGGTLPAGTDLPDGLSVPEGARLVGSVFMAKHLMNESIDYAEWQAMLEHEGSGATVVADVRRQLDQHGWKTQSEGDDSTLAVRLNAQFVGEQSHSLEVFSVGRHSFVVGRVIVRDGEDRWAFPEWAPVMAPGPTPAPQLVEVGLGRNGQLSDVAGLVPLIEPEPRFMGPGPGFGGSTGVYWITGDTGDVLAEILSAAAAKGYDNRRPPVTIEVGSAKFTRAGAGCGGGCGGVLVDVVEMEGRKLLLLQVSDRG